MMRVNKLFNLYIVIVILHSVYIISYFMNIVALNILTGIIILTFIPGILILKFLLKEKINNLELCEVVLYSIGLSLSFWAFLEFFIDSALLYNTPADIKIKLFTKLSIFIIINVAMFVLVLLNLKYRRIKFKLEINQYFLGIYLINYYNINILALLSIIAIACILLAAISNKIPTKSLFFAIWIISLSLLYLNSLLGLYPRATDNINEYYFSNLILKNGCWRPTTPAGLNAMLNVVMLIPTYSLACSVSLNFVFKIIVPFIASFIPVGLYVSFKKITNEKIAFLSCFFFASMYEYYTWLGLTMKMVTAGLYITLLIMILTDDKLDHFVKNIFSIIFGFSLVVSHYGTSYIFMFCIIGAFIVNKMIISKLTNRNENLTLLTSTYVILFITFAISWYMYNSSSSLYDNLINIGDHIIRSIAKEYIMPERSYIYRVVNGKLPMYLQILKILYIISTVFIIIGLVVYITHILLKRKFKLNIFNYINNEYLSFSILYCIAGGTVFLGSLSGIATPDRIYIIISFFLAPFCVIGGAVFIESVKSILTKVIGKSDNLKFDPIKLLSIYFIIFLLFNTCFAAETIWKYNVGPMVSISEPRIVRKGTINEKEYLDRVYIFPINIIGTEWLNKYMVDNKIYCTANSKKNFVISDVIKITWKQGLKKLNIHKFTNRTRIPKGSYIYLSKFNVETGKMKIGGPILPKFVNVTDNPEINISNKIYTNGGCCIFYLE